MEKTDNSNTNAARYMVMYHIWFHEFRKPKEQTVSIEDSRLGKLFPKFCNEMSINPARIEQSEKYVVFDSNKSKSNGTLARIRSGSAGEYVDVYDTATLNFTKNKNYGPSEAGMISSRCFLICHPGTIHAHLCVEHVTNGAGDTTVPKLLRSFMRKNSPEVTMEFESVMNSESLDMINSLDSIELRQYLNSSDLADRQTGGSHYKTFSINRGRGKSLSISFLNDLIRANGGAINMVKDFLGIKLNSDQTDGYEIYATVTDKNGRKKRFPISDPELSLRLMVPLNNAGEPFLEDESFIDSCTESCAKELNRLGRM